MQQLGKSEINLLARFLRDVEVPLLRSKNQRLIAWLQEHFNCQSQRGGLHFTPAQKRELRSGLQSMYPRVDWLSGVADGQTRLQISQQLNDDKIADIQPNSGYLLLKPGKNYKACGLKLALDDDSALRLPVASLRLNDIKTLLIIENLDVFDNWCNPFAEVDLADALVVYRGDDKSVSSGVMQLLQNHCFEQCIYFGDLDPAGLQIAHTLPNISHILAPALNELETLKCYSQPQRFVKQQNARTFLRKQPPSNWQALIDAVLNNHLVVVQQHFIVQKPTMQLYAY